MYDNVAHVGTADRTDADANLHGLGHDHLLGSDFRFLQHLFMARRQLSLVRPDLVLDLVVSVESEGDSPRTLERTRRIDRQRQTRFTHTVGILLA